MTLGAQDTKEVSAKVLTMMSIADSDYLASSSVDKEQFQKMITEMVASMDANGDGQISFVEVVESLIKTSGVASEAEFQAQFDKDINTQEKYDELLEFVKTQA
jgi:hypothetical protein